MTLPLRVEGPTQPQPQPQDYSYCGAYTHTESTHTMGVESSYPFLGYKVLVNCSLSYTLSVCIHHWPPMAKVRSNSEANFFFNFKNKIKIIQFLTKWVFIPVKAKTVHK